jgi:hypothetical protein
MSVDRVGGPGGVAHGPCSANNEQTTATVRVGENTIADVAKRLNVDVSPLLQANPNISGPHQKLSVGQELNLPQAQTNASARDVSTGAPMGRRMHRPTKFSTEKFSTENAPRNIGGEVKLSAAFLPQLQGGVPGSTAAADALAKFEKYEPQKNDSGLDAGILKHAGIVKDAGILKDAGIVKDGGIVKDAGILKYDLKANKQR